MHFTIPKAFEYGTLYGIPSKTLQLATVNTESAKITLIGPESKQYAITPGLSAIDNENGIFYTVRHN